MKIKTTKQEILSCVSKVAYALPTTSINPIFGGILFSAEKDSLTLTASDSIQSIRLSLPIQVEVPGEVVLPGYSIKDLLRHLTENDVIVAQETPDKCTITCGKSKSSFKTLPANEYPQLPSTSESAEIKISAQVLKAASGQILPAVDENETNRPFMTGMSLKIKDGKYYFAGTDGHRLAVLERPASTSEELSIIIGAGTIKTAEKLFGLSEEQVAMFVGEGQVVFECENVALFGRTINEKYPEYMQLIPHRNCKSNLRFKTVDLMDAIKRISVIKPQKISLHLPIPYAHSQLKQKQAQPVRMLS